MIMSSTEISSNLEEQALQRRQKLMQLKRKKEEKSHTNSQVIQAYEQEILPKPLFRSYKPTDEKLQERVMPDIIPENIEPQVRNQIDSSQKPIVMNELDVTTLAPRKPDWDLKRDISNKIDILERQTQKAIGELIRERLKDKTKDLAAVVNVGSDNVYKE